MTRYFVIGSGSIGRRHHENLESLGADVRLIGWRKTDLGAIAELLDEASRAGDAAVVIATASQVRLELIEICGQLAIPFYVEKPIAFRRNDLERIRAAAEPVLSRSIAGFMMRYHPAFLALSERPIEDTYSFHFEIGHDVRQWRPNWRFSKSYAALPDGGGVLLDLCHELDMASCLFPGAGLQHVDCIGHVDFPGVDFSTHATLTDTAGTIGSVSMDYLAPESRRRLTICGRSGVLDLDWLALRWRHATGHGEHIREWAFERNDMFLALMRDFMALVEGRTPSSNPFLPTLDRVKSSSDLVASAWESRAFRGAIEGGFE